MDARGTHKRLNITLPGETVRLLDRVAAKGNRSRFLNDAVRFYVREVTRSSLRKRLRESAVRRAERDLELAEDWFHLDDEIWQRENAR